jgi:hypothetical protein
MSESLKKKQSLQHQIPRSLNILFHVHKQNYFQGKTESSYSSVIFTPQMY